MVGSCHTEKLVVIDLFVVSSGHGHKLHKLKVVSQEHIMSEQRVQYQMVSLSFLGVDVEHCDCEVSVGELRFDERLVVGAGKQW